jgi:PKD repeat protein
MRNALLLILIITILSVRILGQTETNTDFLLKFAHEKDASFNMEKARAVEWANQNGRPVILETGGSFLEIQYIDEFGLPQYFKTDNVNAAATISTNKVYPGGGAGLNLTGTGITVREWDGGTVLATHQEFGGRVTNVNSGSTHYHSTHVAGTILASGVVSSAKGMAYQASLRAFEWNNDESEMASEAASGALMSNHSYGFIRGWYGGVWYGNPAISTLEDYLFGFYDSYTRNWDQIAHNAPNFLICKSAGNDRGESGSGYPPDGPYDCIGQQGVAKNVLTVGAVGDIPGGYTNPASVVMSSFSSWGPADDGRIKPDVVANGISLYSTDNTSNTSYLSLSGTSMSTPSVCGSLALLQQHYYNLNGAYMKSATLKALVIHTADEAGSYDGPDYMFGWGLMNTKNAALKISQDQTTDVLGELVMTNGGIYSRDVIALGTEPLKVTIVWTDPPGTPPPAQLDPITPMLVNDLDLRITFTGNTYYPWKCNRDVPANAATNSAENNVDNVEVVYIASPSPGATYTITVDHDGTLSGGSQAYSIVISGIANIVLPPVANFSASITDPTVGETVNFTDLSTNTPTSWSWTFLPSTVTYVGGTSSASTNPKVQFNEPGYYTVSLTVSNTEGQDTEIKTNYILASLPPVADFTADDTSPTDAQIVTFTDLTTNAPTSWSWAFTPTTVTYMGGTNSTSQNPQVIFDEGGYYHVSLTAANGAGSDQEIKYYYIFVVTPTNADFEADNLTPLIGQMVYFGDLSTNNPTSWLWEFNPNTITYLGGTGASSQEPQVQFNAGGYYTVSLTASNELGPDTETKVNYIYVQQPGLWKGSTSSDWSVGANWDDGVVPLNYSDVTIQAPSVNFPIYTGNFTVGSQCNSLTLNGSSQFTTTGNLVINSGKILTVSGAGKLVIGGNWNNSGTFNKGSAMVEFNGNNPGTIVAGTTGSFPITSFIRETFPAGIIPLAGGTIGPTGDDAGLTATLGFSFNFLGTSYSFIRLSTNGWISLNRSGVNSYNNNDLFTSTAPSTTIAPWFDNLADDATSVISYKTEGVSPGRVFTAEWYRVPAYQSGADARISFQVKLYEQSNVIELLYGDMEAGTHNGSESASIGIEDATGGSGHFIEATTGSTTTGISNLTSSADWPQVNYRFVPPYLEDFNDVVVSKTGNPLTVNKSIRITGDLTVNPNACLTNSGAFIGVNGNLNLLADENGMASFINNGATGIEGSAIVQEYLSSERWHLVTSPVTDATISTYLSIYLKEYNEPTNTWGCLTQPTTIPMNICKGYAAWASDLLTGSKVVNFIGSGLNNSTYVISDLDYTPASVKAGFNLVGNPYPCAVDWNSDWSSTNLSGWAVVYENGIFRGWHPTLGGYNGKTDGIIPATNGFWVRATNYGASLTIPNSERVHNTQTFYKESHSSVFPEIKIAAECNGYSDEMAVIFHPEGTTGFDGYYDLETFENVAEAPTIFSIMPSGNFAVNVMPESYNEAIIPVGFKFGLQEPFSLKVKSLLNFDSEYNIYLEDLASGVFVKVYPEFTSSFEHSVLNDVHRFNLHFTKNTYGIDEKPDENISVWSYHDRIYIRMPLDSGGRITVADLSGKIITVRDAIKGNLEIVKMTGRDGFFTVKVLSANKTTVKKVIVRK